MWPLILVYKGHQWESSKVAWTEENLVACWHYWNENRYKLQHSRILFFHIYYLSIHLSNQVFHFLRMKFQFDSRLVIRNIHLHEFQKVNLTSEMRTNGIVTKHMCLSKTKPEKCLSHTTCTKNLIGNPPYVPPSKLINLPLNGEPLNNGSLSWKTKQHMYKVKIIQVLNFCHITYIVKIH